MLEIDPQHISHMSLPRGPNIPTFDNNMHQFAINIRDHGLQFHYRPNLDWAQKLYIIDMRTPGKSPLQIPVCSKPAELVGETHDEAAEDFPGEVFVLEMH